MKRNMKRGAALLLSLALMGPSVVYADYVESVVSGVVGGVVGSVITNEIYRNGRRDRVRRHRVRHIRRRRHVVHRTHVHHPKVHKKKVIKKKVVHPIYHPPVPVMTSEKKIQKALSALGFYHGPIDGQINSYETRSAIKAMNSAYERGNTAALDPKARETLIYLGDLFALDRYLVAQATDQRTQNKRLQAALKIHGTYYGKIDGIVGRGTRRAIRDYTGGSAVLDYEEERRLMESAKQKNDRNIEEAVASLKENNRTRPISHAANNTIGGTHLVVLQTTPSFRAE